MSLKKMDLYVFSFLSIICEFLSLYFFDILNSGFYLSFAFLLFLIMSLRWGYIGIIPFIISSIPAIAMEKNLELYQSIIFYGFSNIFAVIPITLYRFVDKKQNRNLIIQKPLYLLLYSFLTLLSLAFGKGVACLIINHDFKAMLGYITSMIFTFVLSYAVLFGLSKLKNSIVIDMNQVLNNESEVVNDGNKNERGESENDF